MRTSRPANRRTTIPSPNPDPSDVGDVGGYPEPDAAASAFRPMWISSPATTRPRLPATQGLPTSTITPIATSTLRSDPQADEHRGRRTTSRTFHDAGRSRPLLRRLRRRRAAIGAAASGRGGHRSDGGRRGVSIGVIAALVAVVVVVAGVILWRFFGDALSNRSHTAAACTGSKETVAVIADPSIADHVQQFARALQRVGRHRSAITASRSASNPRAPTPSSTGSSGSGPQTWASGPRCGSRPARCRRRG